MQQATIVTGGSGGIGRALVERLLEDGQDVINLDRAQPLEHHRETFFQVDLSDPEQTDGVLDAIARDWLITRLVNNAAILVPASFDDMTMADFDAQLRVNLRSVVQCSQSAIRTMRAAGFGRIVNIASVAALGKRDRTAYSASKAALCGLTRTWALELGRDGITVNAIAPGAIDTSAFRSANPASGKPSGADRIPVGRLGTPDDVAHAASFLMSAHAGFVTGQILYVCGGSTIGASR